MITLISSETIVGQSKIVKTSKLKPNWAEKAYHKDLFLIKP